MTENINHSATSKHSNMHSNLHSSLNISLNNKHKLKNPNLITETQNICDLNDKTVFPSQKNLYTVDNLLNQKDVSSDMTIDGRMKKPNKKSDSYSSRISSLISNNTSTNYEVINNGKLIF